MKNVLFLPKAEDILYASESGTISSERNHE